MTAWIWDITEYMSNWHSNIFNDWITIGCKFIENLSMFSTNLHTNRRIVCCSKFNMNVELCEYVIFTVIIWDGSMPQWSSGCAFSCLHWFSIDKVIVNGKCVFNCFFFQWNAVALWAWGKFAAVAWVMLLLSLIVQFIYTVHSKWFDETHTNLVSTEV